MIYGGGESNVVVFLVNYGIFVFFVIWLLNNDIGECVFMEMWKCGVDINYIVCGGECLGIYFLEIGVVLCGSKVVYDWSYLGMVMIEKGMVDWELVFVDV